MIWIDFTMWSKLIAHSSCCSMCRPIHSVIEIRHQNHDASVPHARQDSKELQQLVWQSPSWSFGAKSRVKNNYYIAHSSWKTASDRKFQTIWNKIKSYESIAQPRSFTQSSKYIYCTVFNHDNAVFFWSVGHISENASSLFNKSWAGLI